MKKITAILIAFFLCASATQVSAQRVLTLKTITVDDYTVEPTDENIVIFGTVLVSTSTPPTVRLPNPTTCKGRVVTIINRRGQTIIIHPFRDGSLFPTTGMIKNTAAEWISDGNAWYPLSKAF